MTIGHKLGLRLFLEGIEVPVIGVSLTISANAPVTAAIQVIATDKILNIMPRTVVHLFFYDFVQESVDYSSQLAESRTVTGAFNTDYLDAINYQYKILFMGEVQGLGFSKDSGNRSVVLNCVDFSNYWDTTYQYNFRGSLLGGRRHAAFIGANANFFTSPLGHGTGTIAALLCGRPVSFPNLKGLMGGVVRLLEAIGGAYYGYNTFKGANDFTSIAELRLKILQQIWAPEKDHSTAQLFAHKAFAMWMNRQSGSLGKLVTFRGLTQMLQQFIFTAIYPNPVAKYQPKVTGLKKSVTSVKDLSKDSRTKPIYDKVKKIRTLLTSAQSNLQKVPTAAHAAGASAKSWKTGIKMAFNPVAGGGIQSFKQAENDLYQTKRLVASLEFATLPSDVKGLNRYTVKLARSVRKVYKIIGKNSSSLDLNKSAMSSLNQGARDAIDEALGACAALLGLRIKKSRMVTYDKQDRVYNQILRPDVWYAPPPRCNVLFPELYSNFTWTRNFLREVSRLELQTTNEILGDDALFNGRYYAPNVVDMRKGVRLSSQKFNRLIMKHELFTGIIPMFEKISEANLFAMKADKAKYKGAKISYAQRAVNHNYFKHRFASRSMQANGRFNPWFVCGFPALLIDKPMDVDKLAISRLTVSQQKTRLNIDSNTQVTIAELLQALVPVQYLGSCITLVHNVNQGGGTTSYGFGQARLHRESTEYLGVDKVTISKKTGDSVKTTPVATIPSIVPKVGGRGPNGGRITKVIEATKKYQGKDIVIFRSKSLGKVGGVMPERYVLQLQRGSTQKDWDYAVRTGKMDKVMSGYKSTTLVAYEVTETIGRYLRTNIDWPIEFAVRPPWIWDGWGNLKIGETYHEAFGTNSITDIDGFNTKDASLFASASDLLSLKQTKESKQYGSRDGSPQLIATAASNAQYDASQTKTVTKPDKDTDINKKLYQEALKTISKERTIENSVDYLVRIYSFIKHNSLDVGAFLRNYTWRPVATMVDILGSADFTIRQETKLQFSDSFIGAGPLLKEVKDPGNFKTTGTEGFHSRAFGDVSNLFGLVDARVKKILGLGKNKEKVAKKLDVRAERRKKVTDYMDELTNSKGLLG